MRATTGATARVGPIPRREGDLTVPTTARRRLTALAATLTLALVACLPVAVPGLRNINGQTWSARFEVEVRPAGLATVRLPVNLALTFNQRLDQVTAKATLQYDAGIFRLESPGIVDLEGRLGLDDHLSLRSGSKALTFDGTFVGDRLVGTVAIAGVVPVSDVTFALQR